MKYFVLLLVFTSLVTEPFFSFGKNPDVKLEVRIAPEEGWMNGGYGSLFFKYINHSGKEIRTGKVTGEWETGGENYNNWDWNPRLSIPAGSKKEGSLIAWMPPKTEKPATGSIPVLKGEAVVFAGDEKLVLPYSVKIPVAQLPSPPVSKKGKYIKLILQEQTWKEVKEPDKVVDYVDKAYETMLELTDNRPFNGDLMALKECPRNPYFAYAGNPVILNRTFGKLNEKRLEAPEGMERIFLALAVLNQSCDEDLIPLYKKWRIPLDRDKLMSIGKKYQLDTI